MNIEDAEVQPGIPSSWTGCSESWDTVPVNSHLRGETTKSSPLESVALSLTTGQASLAETVSKDGKTIIKPDLPFRNGRV